jgi:CBS domain-containing protein
MRPPLTTVEQAAAAAHLMKHAGATALLVLDGHTDQPIGIITQADITRAVADRKDVNRVRIYDLMTTRPTVISTTTSVRDAANAAPEVQDVLVAFAGWMAQQESRRRSERIKPGWTGAARKASRLAGCLAPPARSHETQRLRRILGEGTTPRRPPGQDSTSRSRRR